MKSIWKNLFNSFNNYPIGFSSKKLTIFAITLTCFIIPIVSWNFWAYKNKDWSLLASVLTIVAGLISALFAGNIIDKYKNKTDTDKSIADDKPKVD